MKVVGAAAVGLPRPVAGEIFAPETFVLDNGLQVVVVVNDRAPVVSHWVWYRVGARNELPGKTGISHWVEHMMFKGTATFPKGTIFKSINVNGGTYMN
ncbi:MAG: insulinase family protein [Nitrospiraceae bacterium]|nr:insulinase family protein [Nitrospiraceae bacterium]